MSIFFGVDCNTAYKFLLNEDYKYYYIYSFILLFIYTILPANAEGWLTLQTRWKVSTSKDIVRYPHFLFLTKLSKYVDPPLISMTTMASRRLCYTSAILFYTATASARASSPLSSLSTLASSSGFVGSRFAHRKNLNHHKHKQLFSTTKIMSTTSSYKRAKLSHLTPSTKTIGTHSGTLWVI